MDYSLDRILADETLSAELLRRVQPAQPEGLESAVPFSARDRLRRLLESAPSLEKIVRADGRPALFIRQNTFDVPEVEFWREPLEAARPAPSSWSKAGP
jgi:hypothetical protein